MTAQFLFRTPATRFCLPLIAAALGTLLLCGCKRGPEPPPPAPTSATSAASVAVKSPREQAMEKFLRDMNVYGKPVLIEFGLVGCKLSDKGLDAMLAVQRENSVPGLAMVRVEGNQNAAAVDGYYKAKPVPFPLYRDAGTAVARSLSATAYPTFLLVDKFGHVRYQGSYPQENLVKWGAALAAETADPGSDVALFGAKRADVAKLLACKLPDLKDQPHQLREFMGEGGLMVLFVDTSCPFSKQALDEMPTVSKALTKQNIRCVIVNNDDPKATVTEFYASMSPGAPVLYDAGASTRELFDVHSVPIAVYISPAGAIGYQGEAVWAKMGAAIEKSLGLAGGMIRFTSEGTGYG